MTWTRAKYRTLSTSDEQFRSALREWQVGLVLGQSVPDYWNVLLPNWRAELLQKCRETECLPWAMYVGDEDD